MASIGGVSSNNATSSLYNSANIISGLASGLDTEGMIESLVQSYQTKIQTLTNKATKLQWKQDSYRSIISKMVAFSNNYTSYTSSTNLLSASFFNSAVKVAPQGVYANKVTASGRTDSDVKLNSVTQLATAARYMTTGNKLKADGGNKVSTPAGKEMDFNADIDLSRLSGSLSFAYGSKTVSISFDEIKDQIPNDATDKAAQLKKMIEDKLSEQSITLSDGTASSASDRIGVEVDASGNFTFTDKSGAGNSVSISSASDSIKSVLGLGDMNDSENPVKGFQVSSSTNFTYQEKAYEYISGKGFNISVDGVTKTIQAPQIEKNSDGSFTLTMPSTVKDNYGNTMSIYDTSKLDTSKYTITKQGEVQTAKNLNELAASYTDLLSKGVSSAFGSKLTVKNTAVNTADTDGKLSLEFEVNDGSNLLINTSAGDVLGIGRTPTNYLNTSDTLEDLLEDGTLSDDIAAKNADGSVMKDKNGNTLYDFTLNGVLIGRYTKDSKLSDIISDINSNSEAGVKASYSKTTREFVFNSTETGSESQIKIEGGLAEAIFGTTEFSETSSGSFVEKYGISWLKPGESEEVTFKLGKFGNSTIKVAWDDTIEDVADKLNKNVFNFGLTAGYNKYTGQLEFTDKSGAQFDFTMTDSWGDDVIFDTDYAPKIDYTPGQDAKFEVEVNGTTKQFTRGSNSVEIDGLTINFKDTFNKADEGGEAVTFQISTDSDKIVDAVKAMINDYNEMMSEIRSAYATMPYQNSSGAFQTYEPLSDEDRATMSESAIQNYEAKAKQGILFGDSTLRTLYENMRNIFQPTGSDAALLAKMGISVSFDSENVAYVTLDENKMRDALEEDPDAVANLFTRTGEAGVSSNGIMQSMKTQLDRYAGLTGAVKGIMIQQAGTPLNSLSLLDNEWQKQIDSIGTQIEKWQDKLSNQVDRYTSMFSKLEVLINQMNSQSSTLAGLMGG